MTEEIFEEELITKDAPQPFFNPKGLHPGVTNGRRCWPKKNTSKKRSRVPLERALAGWDKHIEKHPRDGMAIRCRANVKERLDGMAL